LNQNDQLNLPTSAAVNSPYNPRAGTTSLADLICFFCGEKGHGRVFSHWPKGQAVGSDWPGLAATAHSFAVNAYSPALSDMSVRDVLKLNFLQLTTDSGLFSYFQRLRTYTETRRVPRISTIYKRKAEKVRPVDTD